MKEIDDVIDGASRSTVLPNGIKMEKLSLSPEEAQYLETRKFSSAKEAAESADQVIAAVMRALSQKSIEIHNLTGEEI